MQWKYWIPGYWIWWENFRRTPTKYEMLFDLLKKIKTRMKRGEAHHEIRHWLIVNYSKILDRVWIRRERIAIVVGGYFGMVVRNPNGKLVELIPII